MKLAVVGSRSFGNRNPVAFKTQEELREANESDYQCLCAVLDICTMDEIVSGGASGADRLAERYALERGLKIIVFPAKWDKYPGKTAAYQRNQLMVDVSDGVVAFWDGESKGTRMTMLLCREAGKPVMVVRTDMIGGVYG